MQNFGEFLKMKQWRTSTSDLILAFWWRIRLSDHMKRAVTPLPSNADWANCRRDR
jgi:hypothetical protein